MCIIQTQNSLTPLVTTSVQIWKYRFSCQHICMLVSFTESTIVVVLNKIKPTKKLILPKLKFLRQSIRKTSALHRVLTHTNIVQISAKFFSFDTIGQKWTLSCFLFRTTTTPQSIDKDCQLATVLTMASNAASRTLLKPPKYVG